MDPQPPKAHDVVLKAMSALTAAAVGDALGWPQEGRAVRAQGAVARSQGFQRWTKRVGGRFYSHEEAIEPGEYSDDTQLILCTARSLQFGRHWWDHFTRRELETWSMYERGGGRATKRAVVRWLGGHAPWERESSPEDRALYFIAGGNGVAMRVLPHVLQRHDTSDFKLLARDIIANGISTHGHPRALLGALLYGNAVWEALRLRGTLEYGTLIDRALDEVSVWAGLPDISDDYGSWLAAAESAFPQGYAGAWDATIVEVVALLEKCRHAMKQGALFVDHELLTEIGCFSKSTIGSGTVTAVASLFMASRYAADPIHGILEGAFAHGADTDTIASMTGGLLGAALGNGWLHPYGEEVQDATYLRNVAASLVTPPPFPEVPQTIERVTRASINVFLAKLMHRRPDESLHLPDGRLASILPPKSQSTRSGKITVLSWRIAAADGQSLYVKRFLRGSDHVSAGNRSELTTRVTERVHETIKGTPIVSRIGIKLYVADLRKSVAFYQALFQLPITKSSGRMVNLSGVIALVAADQLPPIVERVSQSAHRSTVFMETPEIEVIYAAARNFNAHIVGELRTTGGRKSFKCFDPDANLVEVFQSLDAAERG